jgi:prolycopene isomerase
MRPSLSFIVIHLGISRSPADLFRASSIGYYPGGTVEGAYHHAPGRIEDKNFFLGFTLPSLTDDSLAPPGKHTVSIHRAVAADQIDDWAGQRESIADAILEKVERIFPGLRASVEYRSIATPSTFERYTWNRQGAAYGWEASPDRWPALARLREDLPERFFQVGHWSDYGGGTVGAMASGHEVAQNILKGWLHQARGTQHAR